MSVRLSLQLYLVNSGWLKVEEVVTVPDGGRVRDLLDQLRARYPELREAFPPGARSADQGPVAVIVNGRFADLNQSLRGDEEVKMKGIPADRRKDF